MRRKNYPFYERASIAAVALGLLAGSVSPAMAQQADISAADPGGGLDEIVVTAQKREQNVQNVPIAVTAFTAEALSSRGISSVQGLTNLTPNVNLDAGSPFSGTSAVLTAFIRGIGQDDFAFNLDPGVGIYVDGVYLARTVGANTDLLDVERIEVLKGPQGTLFGRNSIGGAISIVTRRPGNALAFKGEITTGRYNRLDVRGSVDVPLISDQLLSSITFSKTGRDGYVKRIPYPGAGSFVSDPLTAVPRAGYRTTDLEGAENQWTVRGKLLWRATPDIDVTLTGDYQKVDQAASATTLLDAFPLENVPGELFASAYNLCINVPTALLPNAPGGNIQALCGPLGTSGGSIAAVNVDANPNNNRLTYDNRFISPSRDESYATGPSFSKLKNWGVGATLDWSIGSATLKSISAYRELHWAASIDTDGSPIVIVEPGFLMNQRQFSEELQLTGKAFNDKLDYVFGAYYFTEQGNLHDYVPFAAGLLQIDGENTFKTSSEAIYTHLNYRLSDAFSVTLGARYTEERKRFEGFQRDPNGFLYKLVLGKQLAEITEADRLALGFPDPNDPLRFYPPGENHKKFSNFSPRIGVEYKPVERVLVYASFSKGYKTGGWTTRLSAPSATAPDFGEERADSWEGGIKSELFDRRLRLNLAGFYTDYKGIQLNQVQGISPTVRNAGNAELYGFELEGQAALGGPLVINGSIGYTHDRYTFKAPGVTAGDRLPKTPRWKVNVSPRYTVDLNEKGAIVFNADYTYTSSLFNNTENTELLRRDPVNMLNGSVTYQAPGGKWSIGAGATNILNDRYLTNGFLQTGGGITFGTYNRPTEWYAKLGVKF